MTAPDSETQWLPAPDPDEVVVQLEREFVGRFGRPADGVWSAPGRVNVIGEHVDYAQGLCLPMALPHRTYAAVGLRDDDRLGLESVQLDEPWAGTLDDVGPGRPQGWAAYVAGVLWALSREGIQLPGMDVVVDGRVPLGGGLSSSAALECGVAVAVTDLVETAAGLDRRDLVRACIEAENVVAGASTGGMDQSISLLARAGNALLLDCRDLSTRDVPWRMRDLGWDLLVVDTRAPHQLVDGQYAARRAATEEAARLLGVASLREVDPPALESALARLDDDMLRRRTRHVVTEIERVREAVRALEANDVQRLGEAMVASHASLRDDYEVTVPELDTAVEVALDHGAAGARMTGGGFGGSVVALVPHDRIDAVSAAVAERFATNGWAAPAFLVATAGAAAGRER